MKKILVLLSAAMLIFCIISGEDGSRNVYGEAEMGKLSVVIDAGHGGTDGGASGITTGCKESDINLNVSLKVKDLLESTGVRVVMTRSNSDSLCGNPYSKQKDMQMRAKLIEDTAPDLVVSVHMNSYPDASVKGAQVFYYPDSESGKQLASKIQSAFVRCADPNNKRVVKEEDFFLLRTYAGPSALVECGFLTNPNEEKLLMSDEYQDLIAYSIFDGIMQYLMQNG